MLKQITKQLISTEWVLRSFSTSQQNNYKVCVCGASGAVGQPLSMLLKQDPAVTALNIYATKPHGIAVDLSHIDTQSDVTPFKRPDELAKALNCADVVLIVSGVPRKKGMSRDDIFKCNAEIIHDIVSEIPKQCPGALIAIVTNPVNSCVPLAAEILKKAGTYNPKRLFGVTTLDFVRSRKFIGDAMLVDPRKINLPVIGGHSPTTTVPVISQCEPVYRPDQEELEKIVYRIQYAGYEVVEAKEDKGSAALSMAHAAAKFTLSLVKALDGAKNIVECTYVESDITDASFFATPISLGKEGVKKNLGLPKLNEFEEELVEAAIPELIKNIQKGIDFAKTKK